MSELLSIQHLFKSFGGVRTLRDISLTVSKQQIVLLTGENGAGKTTLFNIITGLEKQDSGVILFDGADNAGKNVLRIAQAGIVRLYQQPRVFKNLAVWENLVAAAKENTGNYIFPLLFKWGLTKKSDKMLIDNANELLTGFGLQDLCNKMAGELSYGQQKMISFCMIVMAQAKLILLDEPFAGLNPQMIDVFAKMILQMRNRGHSFLLIEHNIGKALPLCDMRIELADGHITMLKN